MACASVCASGGESSDVVSFGLDVCSVDLCDCV